MVKQVFSSVVVLVFLASSTGLAQGEKREQLKSDRDAVKAACSAESSAAKCGDVAVGTGLLKCLAQHKKTNKEFKFSDGCKEAMKTLSQHRKEVRQERAAKKVK